MHTMAAVGQHNLSGCRNLGCGRTDGMKVLQECVLGMLLDCCCIVQATAANLVLAFTICNFAVSHQEQLARRASSWSASNHLQNARLCWMQTELL